MGKPATPPITQQELTDLHAAELKAANLAVILASDPSYAAMVLRAEKAHAALDAHPAAQDAGKAAAAAAALRKTIELRAIAEAKVERGKHKLKVTLEYDYRCAWEKVLTAFRDLPEIAAAESKCKRAAEILAAAKAKTFPGWDFITPHKKSGHPKVEITFG